MTQHRRPSVQLEIALSTHTVSGHVCQRYSWQKHTSKLLLVVFMVVARQWGSGSMYGQMMSQNMSNAYWTVKEPVTSLHEHTAILWPVSRRRTFCESPQCISRCILQASGARDSHHSQTHYLTSDSLQLSIPH